MRAAVIAGILLCGAAVAGVNISNQGAHLGPVLELECRGRGVSCSVSGSVGRLFVDAGAPATCSADAGSFALTCSGSVSCASTGSGGTIAGADTYVVKGCAVGSSIIGIDGGTAYCGPVVPECSPLDGGRLGFLDGGWVCL